MQHLLELASVLSKQRDYQEMLRLVSAKAATLLQSDYSAIVMLNPETGNTAKTVFRGDQQTGNHISLLQTNIIGWSLKSNKSFISSDIAADDRFTKDLFADTPVRSALSAPLIVSDRPIGFLVQIRLSSSKAYSEDDLLLLENLCLLASPHLGNVQRVQDFFEKHLPQAALISTYEAHGLLGKSPAFIEFLRALDAASTCDVRVLLEGASGTGKELTAKAIHAQSQRKANPFIAIDCGAIPDNLIESELFGHEKGAFTGANQSRKGLFAEANSGTLFMDEVSNLSYEVQSKLLRALQENEIRPVGSNKTQKINVRVIAASSIPLRSLVDKGTFREDLFYRLHVYPISLPSLEERREDIPLLATTFLKRFCKEQDKKATNFDQPILTYLQEREWQGNIRELENIVERLVALTKPDSQTISEKTLPTDLRVEFEKIRPLKRRHSLQDVLSKTEEQLIRDSLAANNWNQSAAARELQIAERTIRYKMEKLGITHPSSDQEPSGNN